MTNSEAISVLNNINPFKDNSNEQEYFKSVELAMEALEENDKLKAEIEQLKAKLEQSVKFKEYFMELYNQGLQVANWHLNGDLEPLTNFIDSACEEAERELKGEVKE